MIAKKEKRTKKPERDMNLLNEIKPAGGITFKDVKYITTGSGYEGCIHIYKFPENIDTYWMAKVCNINGTVALVDISTDNMSEVKKNLNKSMKEQVGRRIGARDFAELYDADKRLEEMKRMYDEIKSYNEVIKLVHIRIFLADRSFESLEKKIKNIMDKLETDSGFLTTIYLNESKSEYKSMTRSYKKQKEEMFFPKGQSLTATGVAHGDPFHFSSLDDETGEFLGTTPCGGNVLLDIFQKTSTRLYYNFLAIGEMGSGKSTLLKKQFKSNAIKGNYVRTFDISGEFTILTKTLGGKVIKLDGSEGILNPLEILKAGDDENISFTRHISKVSTFYKFLVGGSVDAEEIAEFEDVLKQLYSSFGLWSDDRRNIQCTGLPAASYPTFTDYLNFLTESMEVMQNEKYSHLEEQVVAKTLLLRDKIRKVIKNIVDTYGTLFDGHTSIDNILDEQIVTFDISTLKELKDEVFDAMIINIISLCWDNCVTNGKLMLNMLREGKIKLWDVTRFLILIDESHRWLNAKKTHALDLVSVYLREARKYFGGIGLASQRAADYVPEGSDSDAVNKLKNIFELTQYKFVFRQSSNAKKLLYQIFDGELTGTQIEKIPKLEIGQCILLISGDKNIEFKVHLTKDEDMLFSGGL
ncbi:VirB4 family type IV secretion system protein [Eubacterium ventriosum]|uniref:VirB4 family type IV secretion system protein n=1 Tax=Eubacterium ventriosum TaxID=39496 RepID=UPI0039F4A27D